MPSCRLLAVRHSRQLLSGTVSAARANAAVAVTVAVTVGRAIGSGASSTRSFHQRAVLQSLRKKMPSAQRPASDAATGTGTGAGSGIGSGGIRGQGGSGAAHGGGDSATDSAASSFSPLPLSSSKPAFSAVSASEPAAAVAGSRALSPPPAAPSSASVSASSPSSSRRLRHRVAASAGRQSFFRRPGAAPTAAPLTAAAESDAGDTAGDVEDAAERAAARRSAADRRSTRLARKKDDDCSDPAYSWRMGLIVERIPTHLNPSPQWELEWATYQERKEERTSIPIPDELKPAPEPHVDPTPVDVTTADDRADNRQSLNRRARDSLYLLVQKTNGHTGEQRWTFPSVEFEALPHAYVAPRLAATSALRLMSGGSLSAHTLGNAPIAYHRYEYSEQYRTAASSQQRGAKLFLFHALYLSGSVDLSEQRAAPADSRTRYTDYVWVPRSQLHEYIADRELLNIAVDVLPTDADYADETDVEQLAREQRERQHNVVYAEPANQRRHRARQHRTALPRAAPAAAVRPVEQQRQHGAVQQQTQTQTQ